MENPDFNQSEKTDLESSLQQHEMEYLLYNDYTQYWSIIKEKIATIFEICQFYDKDTISDMKMAEIERAACDILLATRRRIQEKRINILVNPAITILPSGLDLQQKKRGRPPTKKQLFCSKCGTVSTPGWRRGPDGPNTLCNACGLRYSKAEKSRKKQRIMTLLNEQELIATGNAPISSTSQPIEEETKQKISSNINRTETIGELPKKNAQNKMSQESHAVPVNTNIGDSLSSAATIHSQPIQYISTSIGELTIEQYQNYLIQQSIALYDHQEIEQQQQQQKQQPPPPIDTTTKLTVQVISGQVGDFIPVIEPQSPHQYYYGSQINCSTSGYNVVMPLS